MWILYAFGSALFAGLTAVLAKCGIRKTDSTVATAIRTIVVLIFSWLMVFIVGSQSQLSQIDGKTLLFLVLSRNGCVMDRALCEIISKNWIFPNPFDKEPFDADAAGKKESFKKAGIEYTINQIDQYRACGVDGIHLYALNKYDDVAYIAKAAGLIDLV